LGGQYRRDRRSRAHSDLTGRIVDTETFVTRRSIVMGAAVDGCLSTNQDGRANEVVKRITSAELSPATIFDFSLTAVTAKSCLARNDPSG
jgi:hypothetical protein